MCIYIYIYVSIYTYIYTHIHNKATCRGTRLYRDMTPEANKTNLTNKQSKHKFVLWGLGPPPSAQARFAMKSAPQIRTGDQF